MIDVSVFVTGDRCPRCIDRRVFAVDLDRNLWLCIPSAIPKPWLREQLTEHMADDIDGASQEERDAAGQYADRMMGVLNG